MFWNRRLANCNNRVKKKNTVPSSEDVHRTLAPSYEMDNQMPHPFMTCTPASVHTMFLQQEKDGDRQLGEGIEPMDDHAELP